MDVRIGTISDEIPISNQAEIELALICSADHL